MENIVSEKAGEFVWRFRLDPPASADGAGVDAEQDLVHFVQRQLATLLSFVQLCDAQGAKLWPEKFQLVNRPMQTWPIPRAELLGAPNDDCDRR